MPFELQPTLQGELVLLRPLREEDYDALYAAASDPLVWEQHPANDRYQPEVFGRFFRDAMECGGALIALDAADAHVIGSSRFIHYDEAAREIEIGYTFLARSHWGGRYNGEMKRLMLRHALRFVDSVVFSIGAGNIRSQKAVEKIGAVLAARQTNADGKETLIYRFDHVPE